MSLKFECPHCGQRISATLDDVGVATVCPTCNQALVVPQPPAGRMIAEAELSRPHYGNSPKSLVGWFKDRPRESPGFRVGLRIVVCSIMVLLVIVGLGGVGGSVALWNSAQTGDSVVVRQPSQSSPAPKLEAPTRTPEQFARAIERVNTRLLEINTEISGAVSHPAMLDAALAQLVSQASRISTQECPDDFVDKWRRYISALDQMVSGLRAAAEVGRASPNGRFQNQQELADGTMLAMAMMAATAQMGTVENELESAAARYGVKWRKMGK